MMILPTGRLSGLLPWLRRERFLVALLVPALAWALVRPQDVALYPGAVDWPTIATLAALLALTRGIEASGALAPLALRLMRGLGSPRALALFLVLAAALLSTVLTNDVALFIVVPLTLTLSRTQPRTRHGGPDLAGFPDALVTRLVIFEAMAVNAGSLLSPIGNPQNILLWQQSGLSPAGFAAQMAPLALASTAVLLAVTAVAFPGRPGPGAAAGSPGAATPSAEAAPPAEAAPSLTLDNARTDRPLLALSCALYGAFALALHWHAPLAGLGIALAGLALLRWRLLLTVDWALLGVFVLMFIDIRLLSSLPLLEGALAQLAQAGEGARYLGAVLASQAISNVPATILLLHSQPPDALLAWAVNIGGYGFVLGSLANLIALRLLGRARGTASDGGGGSGAGWGAFHRWSVPLLGVNLALGWALLHCGALPA